MRRSERWISLFLVKSRQKTGRVGQERRQGVIFWEMRGRWSHTVDANFRGQTAEEKKGQGQGGSIWPSQATPKAKRKSNDRFFSAQDQIRVQIQIQIQRRTQRAISMNDSAQLTSIPTCSRLCLLFEMILGWTLQPYKSRCSVTTTQLN